jgi:hypothetical protein
VHNIVDVVRANVMKVSKKNGVRQKIIFSLMILSIVGFLGDYRYGFEKPIEVVDFEIDINAVLIESSRFFVVKSKYEKYINEPIPPEIFILLEGYAASKKTSTEVIIFEIFDKVEEQEKINILIAKGDAYVKEDKLTSPIGSNASEYYQQVLAIDKNNEAAIAGLKKIVNRYLSLADLVIKKNEYYKVSGLIENAYSVSLNYFDISLQIKKYASYIKDGAIFSSRGNLGVKINLEKLSEEKEIKDSHEESFLNSTEIANLNTQKVDKKTARVAKNLVDKKYIRGGIKVLESFTALTDYWGESSNLLITLYLDEKRYQDAEKLVYSNDSLDLFQFAEKAAHIFAARNDTIGAIGLLESHRPAINKYQKYHSLKASLYYGTANYTAASKLYRQLLHVDHTNPIYWLGLAVALDKLDDGKSLQAFHYADYFSDEKSDIKKYIEKNIILSSRH